MKANQKIKQFVKDDRAVARDMGVMVGLLIAIIISVLVFFQLNHALFFADPATNTARNSTFANINSTAQTTYTLLPIVAIVMIAAIILAVVGKFGQGPGGGV